MTRFTVAVIIIFVALGAIFFFSRQVPETTTENKSSIDDEISQLTPVVFTAKSITKGQVFEEDLLEVRELPQNKIPSDAVLSKDSFLERRAGRDIPKGTILAPDDVLSSDRSKWTTDDERRELDSKRQTEAGHGIVVYPIRIIQAGKRIDSLSITTKQMKVEKIPPGSIGSFREIVGRKAKFDLSYGQIITERDLE